MNLCLAAQAGLQRIEAANEGGLEASYDLEMTEVSKHVLIEIFIDNIRKDLN